MESPAIRPGLLVRLLRAVGLVKVDPKTGQVDHNAGADFVPDIAFRAGYDPKSSMSALAAFPWPFACVQAISSDLSKIPIRAYRGEGASAEPLDDHPILDLLAQPSSRVGSGLWRRQLYTDLVLTGNAFILIAGAGSEPQSLIRLHPSRTSITPLKDGQPDAYQYDGGGGQPMRYTYEQVLHIRAPSWSDDPTSLWGTGCVQPLHNDLTTEMKQSALTARTAATGQPTGILSPKEEGDRWGKEQISTLRAAYENQMQAGGSGVLILGGQAQFDKVSFTPREMEFSQVRDFVRASTLAAFDVPPARVGLPNTNYATALAQSKRYWEGLEGRAALVDSELTRLARMFDEDITIRHDFSGVESLQESRSQRLDRVVSWSMLGVPVSEAAAYEGFDDLPFTPADDQADQAAPGQLDDEAEPGAPIAPTESGEPLAATALNGAQISSLLLILANVAAGTITFDAALALIGVSYPTIPEDEARRILEGAQAVPTELDSPTEDEVDEEMMSLVRSVIHRAPCGVTQLFTASTEQADGVWRAFIDDVHAPAEREIQLAMSRYLRGAAARIAAKMPNVLAQRAVGDGTTVFRVEGDWLAELVDGYVEAKAMKTAVRGALTEAFEVAIQDAFKAMPADLAGDFTYDPVRIDEAVDAQLADMLGVRADGTIEPGITATTKEAVRDIVQTGLAEGATIAEIQKRLMSDHAFSPQRSLMISRTEATRSVNAGGVSAWEQQAADAGVEVRFRWRAQPNARLAHKALNNKIRGDDGYWRSGTAKAASPGGFGVAALDINCRCHFTPEIIR